MPPPESAVTPQLLPSLVPLAHVGGGRAGPEEWTEDWAAEGEGSIPGGSFQAQVERKGLSLSLCRLSWKATLLPGCCRVQLGTHGWPCLPVPGYLSLGRPCPLPFCSGVELSAIIVPCWGILTLPMGALGSAGEVSQSRACCPGQWRAGGGAALVPKPSSSSLEWDEMGLRAPQELPAGPVFHQNHSPSEGGVLGPASPLRPFPRVHICSACIHTGMCVHTRIDTLWLQCTRCPLCLPLLSPRVPGVHGCVCGLSFSGVDSGCLVRPSPGCVWVCLGFVYREGGDHVPLCLLPSVCRV